MYIPLDMLRRATEFVDSLADIDDPAQANDLILPGLAGLVRCDVVVDNEIGLGPAAGQVRVREYPAGWVELADMAAFTAHVPEHPLIRYISETGDNQPVKISDVVSQQQFRRLGIYAEFFRPIGIEHQIAFALPPRDGMLTGISLNRTRGDFTERDRAVLSVLAGPLNHAMDRARRRHSASAALETAVSADLDSLTDRELQVLELAAQGCTNHAIARTLDVSPRTIAKHLEHVYHKLGVTSRAAAVYRTVRSGRGLERQALEPESAYGTDLGDPGPGQTRERFQRRSEARRAPSLSAASFAQAMSGSTTVMSAAVANPQSVLASTRSRPATSAYRPMRWAMSSGCSMKLVVESTTPGISTVPSGRSRSAKMAHSWSCRGLAPSNDTPSGRASSTRSMMASSGRSWWCGPS
jgi:DNA-binding CsgD family transcriptional regulator